jgi:hypothetical protein
MIKCSNGSDTNFLAKRRWRLVLQVRSQVIEVQRRLLNDFHSSFGNLQGALLDLFSTSDPRHSALSIVWRMRFDPLRRKL